MRTRRWAALLLVAGCAFAAGRACADPERNAGGAGPRPAEEVRGAPGIALPDTGGGAQGASPAARRKVEGEGRVVRVRDGDSIVVLRGGVGIEVRLDGIDCPELAQAFGRKAKGFTSALAFGRTVRLVGGDKDRYGRELAEVFLPDGRSLNRELLTAGYAWWYRRYSADRGLEALEQAARGERRGLWADANPVPPWEFREAGRK